MTPLEPELKEVMVQEVRLYQRTGADDYGKDVYSAGFVTAKCHIDGRGTEVLTSKGSTMHAEGRVYLAELYPWLDERTAMHVPKLDGTWRWVEIIGVDLEYDEVGPYAQVVTYGAK